MRGREAGMGGIIVLGAAFALGTTFGVGLARTAAASAKPRVIAGAKVATSRPTRRLPRSFIGLSFDFPSLPSYAGGPERPHVAFVRLVRNLGTGRSGPAVLRVGGLQTDNSWWNPEHRRSGTIGYSIDVDWLRRLTALANATKSPLFLGVNLAVNDPELARQWVTAAMGALGRSPTFEIGQAPDTYVSRPQQQVRRPPYGPVDYAAELRSYVRSLRTLNPAPRLAAPVACCNIPWLLQMPAAMKQVGINSTTYGSFPLHACRPAGDPNLPKVRDLLVPRVISLPASYFRVLMRRARALRQRVRLSETNAVGCGGLNGVSNTFASALWGVDWLFTLAKMGLNGATIDGAFPPNAPILPTESGAMAVRPLYYGLLLFHRATSGRARLLRTKGLPGLRRLTQSSNVRFWATRGPGRKIRVVVLNKGGRSGLVRLRVAGARRAARLERLTAPRVSTARRVKFAGQAFGSPTTDGRLRGRRRSKAVPVRGGAYVFSMRRGTAALLSIRG